MDARLKMIFCVLCVLWQKNNTNGDAKIEENMSENTESSATKTTSGSSQPCMNAIVDFFTLKCCSEKKATDKDKLINSAEFVDFISRFIFPSSFVIFNAVYWTVYFQASNIL